jgi:hypothetical protein
VAVDTADTTLVAKQRLSGREGEDIDLGVLDQEAFARVIALGQDQAQNQNPSVDPPKDGQEDEEDEDAEVVDDVTYRPSNLALTDTDPVWSLRMVCLPVLDIFVLGLIEMLANK